jgi:fibronectin-binding autotransporter adhesin
MLNTHINLKKSVFFESVNIAIYAVVGFIAVPYHSAVASNILNAPPTSSDNTTVIYDGGQVSSGATYTILLPGDITNAGVLNNIGTTNNNSFFTNALNWTLNNTGAFNNLAGSTLTNNGTFNNQNFGTLSFGGTINNTGVINTFQSANIVIAQPTIFQGAGSMTLNTGSINTQVNSSIPWNIELGNSANNLFTSTTGTTLTLTGVVSDSAPSNPGSFRFAGPGTLALTGNNTYSGDTSITGGIVNVGHNNALGTSGIMLLGGTLQAGGNRTLANAMTFGANTSSILDNNGSIFTLNGLIDGTGAVTFKGLGTTIVSNNNTYSGTSILGEANTPTTLTMANTNALGTGPIALAGGSTLNPNAGTITLTSLRSLSGVGTVAGNVVNNGGTVTPGIDPSGSYGTLVLGGNYTGSGILNLHLKPAINPIDGEDYGVLDLGTHNFDASNTTLNLVPEQGVYTPGAQYHFLTTTGNVNGTFLNDQTLPNLGAYKPVISYNPQGGGGAILTVEMNRIYLTTALGGNADGVSRPTAVYFDAQPNPALGTPLGDLIGQLDNLTGATLDSALDRVASEESDDATYLLQQSTLHAHTTHESRTLALRQGPTGASGAGAFRRAALSSSSRRTSSALAFLQSMSDQNHAPSSIFSTTKAGFKADADAAMQENVEKTLGRGGYWTHAFGNLTRQKSTADDLGFRSQAGGLMAGGDLKLSSHHFFGLSGGYTKTLMKIDNDGGTHHLNSFTLGAYGTWYADAFALDYSLNGSMNTYKFARRVIIPGGATSDVKSTHKGYEISPRIGLSYELPVENMHVVPFVNISYSFMRENGYRESGGLIDQQINGRDSSFFNTEVGMSVSKDYTLNDKIVTPFFKLSYLYKRPINTGNVVASFIGAQGSYTIQSTNKAVHQIAPQLAGTVRWESGVYMEAAYGAELSNKLQSHEIVLKLGKRF